MRVLILEDDENLRVAVAAALRGAALAVDAVATLPAADAALAVNAYDCAVFDRLVSGGDALAYVRVRRGAGFTVPVLFLTALESVPDRIAGLEYGDDYLTKPFAMPELVARVRRLCLRRPDTFPPPTLRCGDLELDTGRHEAHRAGVLLTLTGKEFAVLTELLVHQGTPVRRVDLIRHGWDELVGPESNVLDVLIRQLRHKLGAPPMIRTMRGVGYRIDAAVGDLGTGP